MKKGELGIQGGVVSRWSSSLGNTWIAWNLFKYLTWQEQIWQTTYWFWACGYAWMVQWHVLKGGSNYCLGEWYAWMVHWHISRVVPTIIVWMNGMLGCLQWLFSRLAPAMNIWPRTNNIHMLWYIWNESKVHMGWFPIWRALGGSLSQLTWMKLDRYITIYC